MMNSASLTAILSRKGIKRRGWQAGQCFFVLIQHSQVSCRRYPNKMYCIMIVVIL